MSLNILSNGLRIITVQNDCTKVCSMMMLIKVGAVDEPENIAGITHMLEHLLFRRTKVYNKDNKLIQEMDKIGAMFNAATDKDNTRYMIKVYNKNLDIALKIMSQVIFHSEFNEKDIKKEKQIVLEEKNQWMDEHDKYVKEVLEDKIFGDNHVLRNSIIGNKKTINSVKKKQLYGFYKRYYIPTNMVLVIAGNCKGISNTINRYFNIQNRNNVINRELRYVEFGDTIRKEMKTYFESKKMSQDRVAIGYTLPYNIDFITKAMVLSTVLGGTSSSKLITEVREKNGLVYEIRTKVKYFQEGGYFMIYFSAKSENMKNVMSKVFKVLENIKNKGVKKEELDNAKKALQGRTYILEENTMKIAKFYGMQYLYQRDKIVTYEEYVKRIDKVMLKDLQEISNQIFVVPIIIHVGNKRN